MRYAQVYSPTDLAHIEVQASLEYFHHISQDVEHLGLQGQQVVVSHGYARNFLYPRQLAAPVPTKPRDRHQKVSQGNEPVYLFAARENSHNHSIEHTCTGLKSVYNLVTCAYRRAAQQPAKIYKLFSAC